MAWARGWHQAGALGWGCALEDEPSKCRGRGLAPGGRFSRMESGREGAGLGVKRQHLAMVEGRCLQVETSNLQLDLGAGRVYCGRFSTGQRRLMQGEKHRPRKGSQALNRVLERGWGVGGMVGGRRVFPVHCTSCIGVKRERCLSLPRRPSASQGQEQCSAWHTVGAQ